MPLDPAVTNFVSAVFVLIGALLMGLDFLVPLARVRAFEAKLGETLELVEFVLRIPIIILLHPVGTILEGAKRYSFWILFGSAILTAALLLLFGAQYLIDGAVAVFHAVVRRDAQAIVRPRVDQWVVVALVALPFLFAGLVLAITALGLVLAVPFLILWLLSSGYYTLSDKAPKHFIGAVGFIIAILGQALRVVAALQGMKSSGESVIS